MSKRIKRLKWNSSLALIYQVILVISGFILPRMFLKYYGSSVYGLTTSIAQFLSFINICDMGISAVVTAAFYRALAHKNKHKISQIVSYAKHFFFVIGILLLAYVLVLIFVYPGIVVDQFDSFFTITLILAMSISQFGQYFWGITNQILVSSDQRNYVVLTINGTTLLINTASAIILMRFGASIQIVKLTTSMVYLARPICLSIYVKKNYVIDRNVRSDGNVIPEKWNGIIQHIAYMVYSNTDVAVLTLFSTLSNVSVYSVYVLVTNSIKTFIGATFNGFQALFGNMIANEEDENLNKIYDFFEWSYHTITTFFYTITCVLIVPFAMIYTRGINDADYHAVLFAVLITLTYAISNFRECAYMIVRSAGHFKNTQTAAMLEALINLGVSIILVFKFGIIGVAIGTMCASIYSLVYFNHYFNSHILNRKSDKFYKQIISDVIQCVLMLLCVGWYRVDNDSYLTWAFSALKICIICILVLLLYQFIFYRDKMKYIIEYIGRNVLRR